MTRFVRLFDNHYINRMRRVMAGSPPAVSRLIKLNLGWDKY